jgi:two-component system, cell cycle response regulator DivK
VIRFTLLFTARPFRAIADSSQDLPRTGRLLHRRSRKAGPVLRPPSILPLIEPDIGDRDVYAYYLHTFGFMVQAADTRDDGLIRASEAEVIVTRTRVPGVFDGVELLRRQRNAEATTQTPIIVRTACAFQADRQRVSAAGCNVLLPKPCLPDRLVSEIGAVLRRSSSERNSRKGRSPTIGPLPVRTPYLLRTRDEAFAQALPFAKRRHVRQ